MTNLTIVVSDSSIKNFNNIPIVDGQLIFMQDKHKIALDNNGKRSFYNQIEILNTDLDRQNLDSPENGLFYFVLGTAVLWYYDNRWVPITSSPKGYVFIGDTLPGIGSENSLYVNKQNKEILIWNAELQKYDVVSNTSDAIGREDILNLFK